MHPALAEIVSRAFYDGELQTHPQAVTRFHSEPCPIVWKRTDLFPDAPLVWVDTPYVQATKGARRSEYAPNYHNPEEAAAVLRVLRHVRVASTHGKVPSLAVLSPYREQVRRIGDRLNDADASFRGQLKQFRIASHQGSYVSTVDSFQGNEADLVVVSLVRNNRSAYLWSALGFLADARRMNVLFSRARWRLVVIGCLDFLNEVVRGQAKQDRFQIEFLAQLLGAVRGAESAGNAALVPLAKLRGDR
jgi:superfamily I DNA and/or RNA helicase